MPDIDPTSLGRVDGGATLANGASTPVTASKTLPSATPSSFKASKPAAPAPRVDLEPIYTSLKSAVSSQNWSTYKDAISGFMLGHLNHDELIRATEHFILIDAARERLHNQLVCAIYANAQRDTPDDGVAVFVSETDKPAVVPKPASGDAEEQRLKLEVMLLPPRFRHRLKAIQDETRNPITTAIATHAAAKRIHNTASASAGAAAVPSSSTTLNKDTDIRRRYNQLLISEARDLPAAATLADRLSPLCYEEGLAHGVSHPQATAELLSMALEMFVREALATSLGRCQTDRPISAPEDTLAALVASSAAAAHPVDAVTGLAAAAAPVVTAAPIGGLNAVSSAADPGVLTAAYRRALDDEAAALARGEIKRTDAGLLPCEAVAAAGGVAQPRDLRIAWELGDAWLGTLVPWIGERIVLGEHEGYYDDDDEAINVDTGLHAGGDLRVKNDVDETEVPHMDVMQVDGPEWSWQGAGSADRTALGALLDDCLVIGQ